MPVQESHPSPPRRDQDDGGRIQDRPGSGIGDSVGRVVPRAATDEADRVFDGAWRGYDREQVDTRVRELVGTIAKARERARTAQDELLSTQDELVRTTTELDRARQSGVSSGSGFGSRVEQALRSAEHEAAAVRNAAGTEAARFLDAARADAEAHRHQVEEELIVRAAKMDEESTRRSATLSRRAQELDDKLAAAGAEAERIRAAAGRDAEQERQRAERRAEELTEAADRTARQSTDAADDDVRKLAGIRDGVRAEMAEMHRILAAQLSHVGPAADRDGAKPPDAAGPSEAGTDDEKVAPSPG